MLTIFQSDHYQVGKKLDDYDMDIFDERKQKKEKQRVKTSVKVMRQKKKRMQNEFQ